MYVQREYFEKGSFSDLESLQESVRSSGTKGNIGKSRVGVRSYCHCLLTIFSRSLCLRSLPRPKEKSEGLRSFTVRIKY